MDADVQIVIERLDALRQRFDDERRMNTDRHAENIQRMDGIFSEVRRTNGRVTTLEAHHRTLAEEFKTIRKRWHDFRDSLQDKLAHSAAGKTRVLTKEQFAIYLAIVGGTVLVLDFLGKINK